MENEDDVLAYRDSILNRWKKYFFQLRYVHSVSGIRQIEMLTAKH
jgi:hypothetical protein